MQCVIHFFEKNLFKLPTFEKLTDHKMVGFIAQINTTKALLLSKITNILTFKKSVFILVVIGISLIVQFFFTINESIDVVRAYTNKKVQTFDRNIFRLKKCK